MKIRLGFVSNSSSDSYLIATTVKLKDFEKWLRDIFKAYIAPLGQEEIENVFENSFEKSFDDSMTVYEGDPERFRDSIREFYGDTISLSSRHDINMEEVDRMEEEVKQLREDLKQKELHYIRIDSNTDNSIPSGIQQVIDDRFSHYIRMHWG